ncbi:lipopolysaccharide biosynthesis protein [Curtobacterium sp. 24E2]|nr:oligosaccharide flippase family protein [Curtobacterium sp. 24E2]
MDLRNGGRDRCTADRGRRLTSGAVPAAQAPRRREDPRRHGPRAGTRRGGLAVAHTLVRSGGLRGTRRGDGDRFSGRRRSHPRHGSRSPGRARRCCPGARRGRRRLGVGGECRGAFLAWATRDVLAHRFSAPALAELWWVLPVTVAAIGVQRVASAVLARRRDHRAIAVRNAAQGIGQTIWNLSMAFAGPIGLVAGLAVGRLAAVAGMARRNGQRTIVTRQALTDAVRQHRRFMVITPWSSMMNVIGQQAPGLLIAGLHGSVAAGFVALTMRVLGSPVGMVADATAQYAAGAFGARIRATEPVRAVLFRLVVRLAVAGAAAAVVVVLIAPTAFGAVFGEQWASSGQYARILAPAFVAQVAVSPITQLLAMLGGQAAQMAWDAARLVLCTAAVLVPSLLGASMPVVLGALTVALIVCYSVVLLLVLRSVRSYERRRLS